MAYPDKYKKIRIPNLRLGDTDVEALVKFLEEKGASSHVELPPWSRPAPSRWSGTAASAAVRIED
jgi:hypothetical protein